MKHLSIIFLSIISLASFAQETIKFNVGYDTQKYSQLSEIEETTWEVNHFYFEDFIFLKDEKNPVSAQKWDAATVLPLLQEEWKLQVGFSCYLKPIENGRKFIANSKNEIFIISDKGKLKLKYDNISENSQVTAIDFNSETNKIFWAENQMDKNCETDSWQIFEYDITKNQKKELLSNKSEKFTDANTQKKETKCNFIGEIKVSPNGKNIVFKYTNIEYENFCTNIFSLNPKGECKNILDRCDFNLNAIEFLDDQKIITAVTNHNRNNNINLKIFDLEGKLLSSSGCYNENGTAGNFISFELSSDKSNLFLYYFKDEKFYLSNWKISGELISKSETGAFFNPSFENNLNLSAFDYNILTLRKNTNNELLGVLFHKYDIFDFIITNDAIITIDEAGTLKKWSATQKNEHLLVLENKFEILSIPVTLQNLEKDIAEINKITKVAHTLFEQSQVAIEKERLILENDYLRFFQMNNMVNLPQFPQTSNTKSGYAQFVIDANMFYFPVKIFQVAQTESGFLQTSYSGRCVNYFSYQPEQNNHIIAILPENKIGYISNEELKSYNFSDQKITEITLKTFPFTETENLMKKILNRN